MSNGDRIDGMSRESWLARAGGAHDAQTGAVLPPLQPATTYGRDRDYRPISDAIYIRDDLPLSKDAERVIAALEGAADAMLFASGMAAANALLMALSPGTLVIAQSRLYFGVRARLQQLEAQGRIGLQWFDCEDLATLKAALRPGRATLVWGETPANPTWELLDIAAAAGIAHSSGAQLVIDSTVATPLLTRPLELGADIVLHSATKFLNGHSDVLAGALAFRERDALCDAVHVERVAAGAVLGAFETWLLVRGMRTLDVRLQRCCASAQIIAAALEHEPKVRRVRYPGLPSHPQHALARQQMQGGYGALLSFEVTDGDAAALRVAGGLELIIRATSLGGVESLIEHRATVEGAQSRLPPGLLRLSVGLENVDDLLSDLRGALSRL